MPSTLLAKDPRDFSDKFNTQLSPAEEIAFQKWAKENRRDKDTYDYDIRGAWKELMSGKMKQADNGHLGDKYKKPNHPTFSDQSKYHGVDGATGGRWEETPDGKTVFTPSKFNLQNMAPAALQRYFDKYEPGVILALPQNKTAAETMFPNQGAQ